MLQAHDVGVRHSEADPQTLRFRDSEQHPMPCRQLWGRHPPRRALPEVREMLRIPQQDQVAHREETVAARKRRIFLKGDPDAHAEPT